MFRRAKQFISKDQRTWTHVRIKSMIKLLSGNGRFYFITYNSSRKLKKGSENGSGDCALIIEFLPLISRLRTRTRKKKRKYKAKEGEWRGRLEESECPLSHLLAAMYTSRNIYWIDNWAKFAVSLSSSLSLFLFLFWYFSFRRMEPLPSRFSD